MSIIYFLNLVIESFWYFHPAIYFNFSFIGRSKFLKMMRTDSEHLTFARKYLSLLSVNTYLSFWTLTYRFFLQIIIFQSPIKWTLILSITITSYCAWITTLAKIQTATPHSKLISLYFRLYIFYWFTQKKTHMKRLTLWKKIKIFLIKMKISKKSKSLRRKYSDDFTHISEFFDLFWEIIPFI